MNDMKIEEKEHKTIKNIIEKLNKSNIDSIYIPRILADVLYTYDKTREHLYYKWLSDYYFMHYIPTMIKNIVFNQAYLIKNKHTIKNKCLDASDYFYYVPSKEKIIQCLECHSINYIIMYEEKYEELHIRRFWKRNTNEKKPALEMFVTAINAKKTKSPLFYKDNRDPGYILSCHSCSNRIEGSIYTQDLIRAIIFKINAQTGYFKNE